VSVDRLADIVWSGNPPPSAVASLKTYVWRLRELLGPEVIATRPPGYVLELETRQIDAREFEQLLRDGAIQDALALWRGRPFAEFADEDWARPSVVRLEEMYATALESHVEALLAGGRIDDAVASAEALCVAAPLRERARGMLMQGLARQGRATEALRAFDTFRRFLADETGLEPSSALGEIQRAVLAQEDHLAPTARANIAPIPSRDEVVTLPSGTVTFLFTDVEGSTRLWETFPDAMRDALALHDELIRAAIEAHSGHVVKTTGDGFLAVFGTAGSGVLAAVAAQRALTSAQCGAAGPLRVRIGLHTGTASLRDGDYFGGSLNRAARLMGVAHGGQIVCSNATADLARDTLPDEITMTDLGEHRLRDLSRAERVVQLNVAGLPTDFAPLTSLDAMPGNLPVQPSSFVGRDRELTEVGELLRDARVVTLTGVGGVGKTRVALHVAADVLPRFGDGAWLVELDRVRDPDVVADAVAAVFGVARRQGVDVVETLGSFLRSKEMLLVLDNCEHVLGAVVALVRALQATCPKLVVLATSREGLGVAGERIVAVTSLDLPRSSDRDAVLRSDAVRLFVERAVAVKSDFAVTDANAGSIAEVVRRLDGIPLALELAAARVPVLSPTQIAQRLDQRFRLLSGGARGAIERHATLRAAIDWSYDLLSADQQQLLTRLSVFAGGCSLEAAEVVCSASGIEELEVLDLLAALVARSLVVVDEAAWGEHRYRLLESIRQYAEERLNTAEQIKLRDRHVGFYADFVENAARGLRGPDQLRWLQQADQELENLRTAMAWALADDDAVHAERFLSSADDGERGPFAAALLGYTDAVLELPSIHTIERYPFALMAGAVAATISGSYARAEQLCVQALDAAGEPNDELEGRAAAVRFNVAIHGADPRGAIEHQERAVRYFRRFASQYQLVHVLNILAAVRATTGDLATATDEAREALILARQTGNPGLTSSALAGLAYVLASSEPERSRELIAESLELNNPLGVIVIDELALVLTIVASAMLGERGYVLRLCARGFNGGLMGITRLAPCLESLAEALASDAPAAAGVLNGYVDSFAPGYGKREPHATFRQRATAAIDAQLDAARIAELRARGAAMTQDQVTQFALDAITRVLAGDTKLPSSRR
jgi:predicted ATPase/class 3 adenylate cyclase